MKYLAQVEQDPVTRGDWRLKNDFIIKILEPEGFGFLNGEEGTIGRTITNDVCDCLFYIFPHLKSLQARSITLHSIFDVLYNKASLDQDYNDGTKYKNKIVQLEKKPIE